MRWNVDVCDSAKNPLTYLFAPVALLETYGFSLTPNSYRVILNGIDLFSLNLFQLDTKQL